MNCVESYLVVGSDSMIGSAMVEHLLRAGEKVIGTTRRYELVNANNIYLDLANEMDNFQCPDDVTVAIVCAAATKILDCKLDPVRTTHINVQGTLTLAKKLVEKGIFVIYLSTNQVFDGSIPYRNPNDSLSPITEYGRQKAEVEMKLIRFNDMVSVVRFTKILYPNMPLFKEWIKTLQSNKIIHPFSDMVMAPVPLSYAVNVLYHIAQKRLNGIVQISGKKDITYEQIARYIAQCIGANPNLLQPLTSKEAGAQLEALPSHTTLDTGRLRKYIGIEPPDVWESIGGVLNI